MTSKIAIIVEWDNARLSEVDRAREMLIRLNTQSAEYAKQSNARFELMLVYDPEEIPEEIPTSIVRECIDEKTWPGNVRLVEASLLRAEELWRAPDGCRRDPVCGQRCHSR